MRPALNKVLFTLTIVAVIAIAVAPSGCAGPDRKITATVAPTVIPVAETPTPVPTPTPIAHPTVTVTDGKVAIKGTRDGAANGFTLGNGVYVVTWSATGTYLSLSLSDIDGNGDPDISKGRTEGKRLFIVDGTTVYPGDFSLMAGADSAWNVRIETPDVSQPVTLPITVSGGEVDGAVSAPFKAHAGDLRISYSLSRQAQGNGYVNIYDATTGASFYTRPITQGSVVGQSMASVPADGIYIAQVIIPPGASYGDITISQ